MLLLGAAAQNLPWALGTPRTHQGPWGTTLAPSGTPCGFPGTPLDPDPRTPRRRFGLPGPLGTRTGDPQGPSTPPKHPKIPP